jgi:hypothetical protein
LTRQPLLTPKSDGVAVVLILLLPFLVNLPNLLGWWSLDPIHFVSGLQSFRGKQILPGYPWFDPNVGFTAQALGKLSADEWLSGRIPWWNSYSGVGLPLAAEMQPASLFLPFALLNHFPDGTLYIEVILQMLAGIGTYLLLKKIGLMRLPAIAGAILFEFNGVFSWHGTPIVSPVAFLPWLVLGIEHARQKSATGIAGGWLTITISLAFSIYAGFPETAYINGLLAAVWSIWRIVGVPAEARIRFIWKLVNGVIVGLFLSMPIIVPFVEYVGRSYLAGHNVGFGAMTAKALPEIFLPWLYGNIHPYLDIAHVPPFWDAGFLSAAQMTTIALGLLISRKCSLYGVLVLWILICLARTFALPFVSSLVDLVPLLRQTAFFRYSPPSWEFCSAILCAIAINDMSSGGFLSHGRLICGLLFALAIVGLSLYPAWHLVRHLFVQSGYRAFLWVSLSWGFGSIGIAALCFKLSKDRPQIAGRALTILLAIDAIALFSIPLFSGVIDTHHSTAGIKYLKQHLGMSRFYTLGPISPNYGAYYHIASINHNYLPIAQNWVDYIKHHLDPYAEPVCFTGEFPRADASAPTQRDILLRAISQYEEIGVRYVITYHSQDLLPQRHRLDAPKTQSGGSVIDKDGSNLELAQLPERDDAPQLVFESGDMDIYKLSRTKPYFEIVQGKGDLYAENRSVLSVNCVSEARLVRRELYYPGWNATISGHHSKIEPYDEIFQSVKLPPGKYKITFTYTPTHSLIMFGLFFVGVFWIIIGMIRSRWKDHMSVFNHDRCESVSN